MFRALSGLGISRVRLSDSFDINVVIRVLEMVFMVSECSKAQLLRNCSAIS